MLLCFSYVLGCSRRQLRVNAVCLPLFPSVCTELRRTFSAASISTALRITHIAVDKWHLKHTGRISRAIYRYLPECTTTTTDRAMPAAAAPTHMSARGSTSDDNVWDELHAE